MLVLKKYMNFNFLGGKIKIQSVPKKTPNCLIVSKSPKDKYNHVPRNDGEKSNFWVRGYLIIANAAT